MAWSWELEWIQAVNSVSCLSGPGQSVTKQGETQKRMIRKRITVMNRGIIHQTPRKPDLRDTHILINMIFVITKSAIVS